MKYPFSTRRDFFTEGLARLRQLGPGRPVRGADDSALPSAREERDLPVHGRRGFPSRLL